MGTKGQKTDDSRKQVEKHIWKMDIQIGIHPLSMFHPRTVLGISWPIYDPCNSHRRFVASQRDTHIGKLNRVLSKSQTQLTRQVQTFISKAEMNINRALSLSIAKSDCHLVGFTMFFWYFSVVESATNSELWCSV